MELRSSRLETFGLLKIVGSHSCLWERNLPSLTFLIVGETAKFAEWNAIEELLLYIATNENI